MKRLLCCVLTGCLAMVVGTALADGTESLGPPSITISSGTGLYADGTVQLVRQQDFHRIDVRIREQVAVVGIRSLSAPLTGPRVGPTRGAVGDGS